MSLSGIEALYFLPLALLVYWLLPRRAGVQNLFLLLCSYLFAYTWNPRVLWVLLVATAVDFLIARGMGEAPPEDQPQAQARRRALLLVSVLYNLAQLAFFKYSGFFLDSLASALGALGLHPHLPTLRVALPIGISFYTFQKLSYVIDVYEGRQPPCRDPLAFATFVAFFPQLTAGPIARGDLLPQYQEARTFDVDRAQSGANLFLLGLVKKAMIADYLAQHLVDPIFAAPRDYSRAAHFLALFGYAAQVFCDFSGYSDMAQGVGRLLGIELPQNFNFPFLSRTPLDFWRRWHISLNTWFFDYIYNPLTTGEGFFRGRLDLGFIVVFLLSGLWHGPRWTYVLWGAMHGVALVVYRRYDERYRALCRKDRSYVALRKRADYAAAAWALTQGFFLLSLVPFRAASLAAAGAFARGLVLGAGQQLLPEDVPPMRALNFALCAAFLLVYHLRELPRFAALRGRFAALPAPVRGACYGLLLAYLLLFVPVAGGTFIYAQF